MIEKPLTEKIIYLSKMLDRENNWYVKYDSRIQRPKDYTQKEIDTLIEKRDACK